MNFSNVFQTELETVRFEADVRKAKERLAKSTVRTLINAIKNKVKLSHI
jgi:hypothetical protein